MELDGDCGDHRPKTNVPHQGHLRGGLRSSRLLRSHHRLSGASPVFQLQSRLHDKGRSCGYCREVESAGERLDNPQSVALHIHQGRISPPIKCLCVPIVPFSRVMCPTFVQDGRSQTTTGRRTQLKITCAARLTFTLTSILSCHPTFLQDTCKGSYSAGDCRRKSWVFEEGQSGK